jgi:hypothetical protein
MKTPDGTWLCDPCQKEGKTTEALYRESKDPKKPDSNEHFCDKHWWENLKRE